MADKRIFQLEEEGFLDDITDKVYMWLDKQATGEETQEPSWKFKANVFLKILNNFATKFVPNVLTVEGKCYWYGGDLYECNTAYSGSWVPANFTATSIDELFARKDVVEALTTNIENRFAEQKFSLNLAEDAVYQYSDISVDTTVDGYTIDPDTGLAVADLSSKIVKFAVAENDIVKIVTTGYSQFQSAATVPSVAPSNRIGVTYSGTQTVLKAPADTVRLVIACPSSETPHAYTPASKPDSNESKISGLASELDHVTGTSKVAIINGGYITTSGDSVDVGTVTTNSNYRHVVVSCSPGDKFTITGTGGSSPRLWCFIKADGTSLDKAAASDTSTDKTITAPSASGYLVVNVDVRHDYSLYKGVITKNIEGEVEALEKNVSSGVNLFDKSNYNVINALINSSTKVLTSNSNCRSVWIPCSANQSYTVSKRLSERFVIGYCHSTPTAGMTLDYVAGGDSSTKSLTLCTASDTTYLVVFLYASTVDTLTLDEILDTLQIQTGVIATALAGHTTIKDEVARVGVEQIQRVNSAYNLFNSNNYKVLRATFNASTKTITSNSNARSVWIAANHDTFYTVKKRASARFVLGTCVSQPDVGVTLTNAVDKTDTSLTIKTGPSDAYLVAMVYSAVEDTLTFEQILETIEITNEVNGEAVHSQPLSVMPDYIVNTMAYKPMAKPNKGYICLVSDDGKEELVTYALPMVIEKEVPLTMAVMSDSEVFDGGTLQAAVIDAVENHGCKIAQHGGVRWTTYSEIRLQQFFASEKAFFDSLGLAVEGAVIPEHYASPLVHAVAGGLYGVVRSGYSGFNADGVAGELKDYYDYYTSGENSNLYGLSSFNPSTNLVFNKAAIDYAAANDKVVIVYWHENSLDATAKGVIEDTIDYAKTKGLEFVTLGQLAHIIDLQRTDV